MSGGTRRIATMVEVYLNMDKCKVCRQPFKVVNKSHVRAKHDLSWEEYEAIGDVQLVDDAGEPIESIWDSTDISAIEFKVKNKVLGQKIVQIRDQYCVDLRQGKNCYGCVQEISEIAVYVILQGEKEIRLEEPQIMKKPYHRNCAIAIASKSAKIGLVMNPKEYPK